MTSSERNSYMDGFVHGMIFARKPWDNEPIREADTHTTQAEKDFCLFSCPYADDCKACSKCDGKGNLRARAGRPKKNIDVTEVVILRETMTIAEICRHLGVGRNTVYRAIERAV